MLNWSFGIILNNMVPKEELGDLSALDCFGIILNNMVPKFRELFQSIKKRFWNHFKYHGAKN